jgi:hypothetical protein
MDTSSKYVNASELPDGKRGDSTSPPFGVEVELTGAGYI